MVLKNHILIKNKLILVGLVLCFFSCKDNFHLNKIEGSRLEINSQIKEDSLINNFMEPYRLNVNKNLDSVLAFSIDTYSKNDGELNTAIGNLMADAVFKEANPIFKSKTQESIDFVLLNHGGIRSILPKGPVTTRSAYQLMPFENSVVVAKLKGIVVKELVNYLQYAKRAHPISGLTIKLDKDSQLLEAKIHGEIINDDHYYNVATNDYLYNGGDNMSFFQKSDTLHILNYKIKNVLIDYFSKNDTIRPMIDQRFIRIN